MSAPDPNRRYPLPGVARLVFLKSVIENPRILVGDYTYYDDPAGPERFEDRVLYHFDFEEDRLVIGKFCQIAAEPTFLMNGANHRTDGISAFPFVIFGEDWKGRFEGETDFPSRGDTVIGNDVWIGYGATFLPGITVGDGAIVAARSVVSADVPPYTVVAGNPARPVRQRFPDRDIATLQRLAWWDWPVDRITAAIPLICAGDVTALARFADNG